MQLKQRLLDSARKFPRAAIFKVPFLTCETSIAAVKGTLEFIRQAKRNPLESKN